MDVNKLLQSALLKINSGHLNEYQARLMLNSFKEDIKQDELYDMQVRVIMEYSNRFTQLFKEIDAAQILDDYMKSYLLNDFCSIVAPFLMTGKYSLDNFYSKKNKDEK